MCAAVVAERPLPAFELNTVPHITTLKNDANTTNAAAEQKSGTLLGPYREGKYARVYQREGAK